MKVLKFTLICGAFSILFACKSKDKNIGEIDSIGELKDYAENIVEETKKSEERSTERRKRGDTLAIPYKELQAFLPQVNGYTSEEGPKGSQTNTPGLGSWSQTEQRFKSGDDKSLSISIMDYNAAHQAFVGLTAMYGMGMSFEDDDKRQAGIDLGIKDVKAYETVYKKDKRQELVLVVADRFIVDMKSQGESDEGFLQSIAKNSMKLQELAAK
jgi:hypothetical protein